jgi:RNA polymerase II-associated protein 1
MALDDNHDSVVLSCTKVVNVMLSCEFNESYFEFSEVILSFLGSSSLFSLLV